MKNAILITGSSRELGFEIAKCLLEKGNNVIGLSRTLYNKELKKFIYSGTYEHIQLDLENVDFYLSLKGYLTDKKISLKGFVNNAAIACDDLLTNVSYEILKGCIK